MKTCKMLVARAGLLGWLLCLLGATHALAAPPANPPASPPTPVVVAKVQQQPLSDRVSGLGTLRANQSVTITSHVSETISRIQFSDGQQVDKGDVLVLMADREESALLQEAQIVMDEAKKQLERVKQLAADGTVASALLDTRLREYNTARARHQALASRMKDHVILAPFAGRVGLREVSEGAYVTPGTTITTLDDLSLMQLDTTLPSLSLAQVAVGQPVEATAREFPGQVFRGTVAAIEPRIDPITRAFRVRVELPNPDGLLPPGLMLRATILTNPRTAQQVPEEAILQNGAQSQVLVATATAEGWVARLRPVQIGLRQAGLVEIIDGLANDESVIMLGGMVVRDGQAIRIKAEWQAGTDWAKLLEASPPTTTGATAPHP